MGPNRGAPRDSDGDGIIDALYPDDDNDGLSTADERAAADENGSADPDGDTLPAWRDTDSDDDGFLDGDDDGFGDSDGDGRADLFDADSNSIPPPAPPPDPEPDPGCFGSATLPQPAAAPLAALLLSLGLLRRRRRPLTDRRGSRLDAA